MLRFHSQTAGSTLTAQQPQNNVVRVSLQGLAAVLGGTQSLHTNSLDEALALPSESAARLALRTQQIIAHESNVAQTVDPLAGSYFIESLTAEIETRAWRYLEEIDRRGGTVKCIEAGYIQNEILNSAYADQRRVEDGSLRVVGVNCFADSADVAESSKVEVLRISPEVERGAAERVVAYRRNRAGAATRDALRALADGARGGENLQQLQLAAVRAGATLGEISDSLRGVFGEFREYAGF